MSYTNGLDKPSEHFETKIWTGNGSSQNITGLNFKPDFVWIKDRDDTSSHAITDAVRGNTKYLMSNDNYQEETITDRVTSFNSDGYSLGSSAGVNQNGAGNVGWNWKAGTSFTNDASATGIGSMDSAGSVNEEAGFAIVSYTGNETASTLKHGLSTVPQMIIVKGRIAARDWIVGHHTQGWTTSAMLNETTAYSNQTHWNNTAPTSSVFTIEGGSNSNVNTNNAAYIAYVFSERQGYSKFGSYVGNGSTDGTFVYTGFKPAFFMIKRTDSAGSWYIYDNKRDSDNVMTKNLFPDGNFVEDDNSNNNADFLSNGFKIRTTSGARNASGGSYIYMAFAENPFTTSTGVPATAR